MKVIRSINSLQKLTDELKLKNKKIGFVPTMGSLHEGHLSLINKCRRDNDIVVLSIFVNPTQFGPKEDFKKYPRQEKKDEKLAKNKNVDIIFYPTEAEMYPSSYLTYVEVKSLSNVLCGKIRPGHFKGVTTIVTKLLNIVRPHTLYLGQKDAQQALIIKKMVKDLNIPVKVFVCPIIREHNGLAKSSRNTYLNSKQRLEAAILYKSLKEAKKKALQGEKNSVKLKNFIRHNIKKNSEAKIDYIECVNAENLSTAQTLNGKIMIALAVYFGKTRLIDNIIFNI